MITPKPTLTSKDRESIDFVYVDPDGIINANHEDQTVSVARVTYWDDGTFTIEHWMDPDMSVALFLTRAQVLAIFAWMQAYLRVEQSA